MECASYHLDPSSLRFHEGWVAFSGESRFRVAERKTLIKP